MSCLKNRSRKIAREMFWEENDRGSYTCPDCERSEEEIPGGFEVHHQNGKAMDNRPENHVALCRLCHNLRERKKPSIEQIKGLRHSVASNQDNSQEISHPDRQISTPETYSGGRGIVRCPGCTTRLAAISEAVDAQFIHSCCGLDQTSSKVPSVAVVDYEHGVTVDTSQSRLKAWMLGEWVRWLAENHTVEMRKPKQVGTGEEGFPIIEEVPVEVPFAFHRLWEMVDVAEKWGWKDVAQVLEDVIGVTDDIPSEHMAEYLKYALAEDHRLETMSVMSQ